MCIYRCEIKVISRKDGRNAILAAAYRAGEKLEDLTDFFTGEKRVHDYTRRDGVVANGLILPESTPPDLATSRQALWNAQERAETRKNSRVAREVIIALPHELSDAARLALVRGYATAIMKRYGVACDYAVHSPDKNADARNHHAHILFTTRRMTRNGLGEKTRELDDKTQGKEEIHALRALWEELCNDALKTAHRPERVDKRSLKERGIHRLPEPKQGAIATQRERQGKGSHAGNERRAVKAYNAALNSIQADTSVETKAKRKQEVKTATAQIKTVRRQNGNVALWLYRRTRALIRAALQRKWQQQQRLRRIWHDTKLREILRQIEQLNDQHVLMQENIALAGEPRQPLELWYGVGRLPRLVEEWQP